MVAQENLLFLASTKHELPFYSGTSVFNSPDDQGLIPLEHPLGYRRFHGFIIGIGAYQTAQRLRTLETKIAAFDPQSTWVVHFGFSGATIRDVAPGTVFIPHFFDELLSQHQDLRNIVSHLPRLKTRQVDRVINAEEKRKELFQKDGSVSIDMESHTVYAWAKERKIPAVSIRTIFDNAGHGMGPFERLLDFRSRILWRNLLSDYATQPRQLARLVKQSRECQKTLHTAAIEFLRRLRNPPS